MMDNVRSRALSILGVVLILCGLITVLAVGMKARNMMLAGIGAGALAWILAWLNGTRRMTVWPAVTFTLTCCIIFGQRALANLLALVGIVQHALQLDAYNKCIIIILLLMMSFSCLITLFLLFTNPDNATGLWPPLESK